MDLHQLIPPSSPIHLPVPFWFVEIFKVLGFTLHAVLMNIWYAGAPIAAVFGVFGRGHAKLVGHRIARTLPFIIAFGINFGIIPLLFIQVAYYRFFYPATVLMAWPWFAVIWLVMAAYIATYIQRLAIEGGIAAETGTERAGIENRLLNLGGNAGIIFAALAFIIVGFIFSNALSLMTHVSGWPGIFTRESVSSAVTGAAINYNDPTLIPRWLFFFGLALTTTAVFIVVDAAFFTRGEPEGYRGYAGRFGFIVYTIGLLWFAGFGSWYIFGAIRSAADEMLRNPIMRIIFPLAAASPGLPWLILLFTRNRPSKKWAALAALAQLGVIGLNAITRQWVQNREVAPYVNVARQPVEPQIGAIVLFLVLFIIGLALTGWMIWRIILVNRSTGGA